MQACAVCSIPTQNRCSRCKQVYYCSVEHQKIDHAEHKSNCTEPFKSFLQENMFNSYYDGALMVYLYATTFEFGNERVETIFQRFVSSRVEKINKLVATYSAKNDKNELDFEQLTLNRARALAELKDTLLENITLNDDQKDFLEPVLSKHREQLKEGDKPLGYVCGYGHAALEIMQRLLQTDLSNKESATELGAAAIATCTVALQVVLERIENCQK